MTDYAADNASSSVGTLANKRTGTSSGDTVPAGSVVLWVNSGAGSHLITLTNNATQDGLPVGNRSFTVAATSAMVGQVLSTYGDANGRVAVAIAGTAAEVTYYVLGGV